MILLPSNHDVNVPSIDITSLHIYHMSKNMPRHEEVLKEEKEFWSLKEPRLGSDSKNQWHITEDAYNYLLS